MLGGLPDFLPDLELEPDVEKWPDIQPTQTGYPINPHMKGQE